MTSMTVERDLALPMLGGVHVFAYLYRPTADSAAFGVVLATRRIISWWVVLLLIGSNGCLRNAPPSLHNASAIDDN